MAGRRGDFWGRFFAAAVEPGRTPVLLAFPIARDELAFLPPRLDVSAIWNHSF